MQSTEDVRIEARTERRTRAKGHEEKQSRRGERNASSKIASRVDRVKPLLARCARSPGGWSWENVVRVMVFSRVVRRKACGWKTS